MDGRHLQTLEFIAICFVTFLSLRSLLKEVNVGLRVQLIEEDLVREILSHEGSGGSVSPIISIEPRRRKFHKPVTITMPLPPRLKESPKPQVNGGQEDSAKPSPSKRKEVTFEEAKANQGDLTVSCLLSGTSMFAKSRCISALNPWTGVVVQTTPGATPPSAKKRTDENEGGGGLNSLRLVCSMSANHSRAVWEDVTESTLMTVEEAASESSSECVQFTSVVSATFWLVRCPPWMRPDLLTLVDKLHKVIP